MEWAGQVQIMVEAVVFISQYRFEKGLKPSIRLPRYKQNNMRFTALLM